MNRHLQPVFAGSRATLVALMLCTGFFGSIALAESGDVPRVDNGGIGQGEVQRMQERAAPYNLRVTFSEGRDSAYVTGVQLRIIDARRRTEALAMGDAGPLTHVQLPPGRYTVEAAYQGEVLRRTVEVPAKGARTLNLHWPQG
jgi:hypothetical protein